ncbi:unnamed protein product [Owenia fusiformis]|uniref:Uncharacterized protein n=1 Tax=Owenia fusiformis TaxID=6347 RepID=A0A8J1TB67_OWEFU|nr:unnamed protein product [Owenia fusiformis]
MGRISCVGYLTNYAVKHCIVLIWIVINVLLFWKTYMHYKYEPQWFYLHQILGGYLCISRGTAAVLNLNCGILLLPMCRGSISVLRGLTPWIGRRTMVSLLDKSKGFHITCGIIVFIASAFHTFGHLFNALQFSKYYSKVYVDLNAAKYPHQDPLLIVVTTVPGLTGIIMILLLVLIMTSSTIAMRMANYDLFYYAHRIFFVLFYALLLAHAIRGILKKQMNTNMHTPGCSALNETVPFPEPEVPFPEPEHMDNSSMKCDEKPMFDTHGTETWMWLCGPILVYVADTIYRYIRQKREKTVVIDIKQHVHELLELTVRKLGFKSRPGQYVLVNCRNISGLEWHPYTITSVKEEQNTFTLHIKTTGDWSGRLKDHLLRRNIDKEYIPLHRSIRPINLNIDGPFGSPCEDILKYKISICVAGGIGITPFIALLNYLRKQCSTTKLERLHLIWLCRDAGCFLWFQDTLLAVHKKFWSMNRPDFLEIHLHCTSNILPKILDSVESMDEFMISRLNIGRPDWRRAISAVLNRHEKTDIGVFCCGPKVLTKDIHRVCSKLSINKNKLYCYHESF